MQFIFKSFPLAVVLSIGLVSQAVAEEEWEYMILPLYLWATDIEGETQIGSTTAPVSVGFSDAVDDLDTAVTVHFEAHKGNKGILANISHIGMDPEGDLPNGATTAVDLTDNIIELAGVYRPQDSEKLEVIYGIRYSDYEMELALGSTSAITVVDESWIDGFVGLRTKISVSDKSIFLLRGDVGTGDSDITWSATGTYEYRMTDRFSTVIGYRWLYYDLELGSGADTFGYDITYEGPLLAAKFRW